MTKKKPWFKNLAIDKPFMYYGNGGGTPQQNLNAMRQATQTNMSSNVVPLGNTGMFQNVSTPEALGQVGTTAPFTQVANPFPNLFAPKGNPPAQWEMNAPGAPQMLVTANNPYLNAPQIMEPSLPEKEPEQNIQTAESTAMDINPLTGQMQGNQPFEINLDISANDQAKLAALQQQGTLTNQPVVETVDPFNINMDISQSDQEKLAALQQQGQLINQPKVTTVPNTTVGGNVLRTNEVAPITSELTAPTTGPQAPVNTDIKEALTENVANTITDAAKGEGNFNPKDYYMFKGMLDMGALMRNMVQQPPPNVQTKLTHLNRMRMDRQPYVDARQQVKEMGRASYRGARENISQMSDFLKMSQAVTSGTQEQLANIGTAEAQQELAVEQQNQQIASQENMMQTEQMNNEMIQNYQIQQEAQRYKDAMISEQLKRIGDTTGAYAMHKTMREQAMRQEEIQKKQANLANEMQLNWMKYEAAKSELAGENYKAAERQAINKYIENQKEKLLTEEEFKILGPDYKPEELDLKAKEYAKELANYEWNIANNPEPDKDKFDNIEDYNNAVEKYKNFQEQAEKKKKELEEMKAYIDAGTNFYNRVKKDFDISGARKDFQSRYLQEAGLPTAAEFIQSVESAIEASRQI